MISLAGTKVDCLTEPQWKEGELLAKLVWCIRKVDKLTLINSHNILELIPMLLSLLKTIIKMKDRSGQSENPGLLLKLTTNFSPSEISWTNFRWLNMLFSSFSLCPHYQFISLANQRDNMCCINLFNNMIKKRKD